MTNQQSELRSLVAYQIAMRGETYNPVVIFDTARCLYQYYTSRDLKLMITDEHPVNVSIEEAISLILADTYSVTV